MSATNALNPSAGQSSRGMHRLATWQACPQRFSYQYNLGLTSLIDPEPLALGSMIHIALMHFYGNEIGASWAGDPVEAMHAAPKRISYTFERARKVFENYKLVHTAAPWKRVLDVEREFRVMAGGKLHTARLDLVVEMNGTAVYCDHKSTGGDVDSGLVEWEHSPQMVSGTLIGQALFPDIYNMPFGGVMIQNIQTRSPFEVGRHMLSVPRGFLIPGARAIAEANEQIDAARDAGRDPWQYERRYGACRGKYSWCSYLPLCKRGESALSEYVKAIDEASEVQA